MNESQTAPHEKQDEAEQFVIRTVPKVQGPHRHPDWVGNMDQTAVFFSMTPSTTLQEQGSRTVNVRTSSSSTMRLTLCVFITASGKIERPFIIFKAKPSGRIAREFTKDDSGYPDTCTFAVQEKAWMNKELCIEWVKTCVKPWADRAPPGIIPYLFLDQFKCHLQEEVVTEIQNCGVEVEYIPGGCTGLCQPVDVGINKPLKNRVR